MKNRSNLKNILGLQQEEMALLLGIHRTLWSMYESGKRDLPLKAKQKLAVLLSFAQENKTTRNEKRIAAERKEVLQTLEKSYIELQYQLEVAQRQLQTAQKIRQQNLAALELITFLETKEDFNVTDQLCTVIRKRSEKQLQTYSEKKLTLLGLKITTLTHQMKAVASKIKNHTNPTPTE